MVNICEELNLSFTIASNGWSRLEKVTMKGGQPFEAHYVAKGRGGQLSGAPDPWGRSKMPITTPPLKNPRAKCLTNAVMPNQNWRANIWAKYA